MLPTSEPHPPFDERILHWLASIPEKPTSKHIHIHTHTLSGRRNHLSPKSYIGDCPHSPPVTGSDGSMSNTDASQSRKRPAGSSVSNQHRRIPPQPENPPPPDLDALFLPGAPYSTSNPPSAATSTTSFDRLTHNSHLICSATTNYPAPASISRPPSPRKSSPSKSLGSGVARATSGYLRTKLLRTTPKIRLGNPYYNGNHAPSLPPRHVTAIIKRFKEIIFGGGYIPGLLKSTLDIHPSCAMEFFPPHVFSVIEPNAENAKALLTHVLSIHTSALEIFSGSLDESAWYPIVRSILCGPPPSLPSALTVPSQMEDLIAYFTPTITAPTFPLVKVCEAQTKLLDQALLPKITGRSIGNEKVDYVVQLNPQHPLLRDVLRLRKENLEIDEGEIEMWTVFGDVTVAESPTVVLVEVKGLSGEYGEGGYQVGLAGVALLTRMVMLAGSAFGGEVAVDVNKIPPVPSVVVVGHVWFLHWMFLVEAVGDVDMEVDDVQDSAEEGATAGKWEAVQMGPIYMGSTESVAEMFRLCKVVEKLKEWAGETGQEGFLGMWRDLLLRK